MAAADWQDRLSRHLCCHNARTAGTTTPSTDVTAKLTANTVVRPATDTKNAPRRSNASTAWRPTPPTFLSAWHAQKGFTGRSKGSRSPRGTWSDRTEPASSGNTTWRLLRLLRQPPPALTHPSLRRARANPLPLLNLPSQLGQKRPITRLCPRTCRRRAIRSDTTTGALD